MTRSPAHPARRDRGAAMLLMLLAILAMGATLLVGVFGTSGGLSTREREELQILEQARRAVLAHLASPDMDTSGRRLGELRLFPDLPIAAGGGADATEPNYDGQAEAAGCATRTWAPGSALTALSTAAASARCFGRLPWRELGLSLSQAQIDETSGLVPWIVASPNLATSAACLANLNPMVAQTAYSGYACPTALPYPWITVVDEHGNVLSNRVAFALIVPGPPLSGQTRGPTALPSAYLDRVQVGGTCPAPCVPGLYDNAAYTHADGTPTVLIRGMPSGARSHRASYFGAGYEFNDRLIYVTVDEYFSYIESRARRELLRRLLAFRTANGFLPYAAAFNSATGSCVAGLRFGHPPAQTGSCVAGDFLSLPLWFTDGGWQRYFVYAVSSRCVRGSNACNAPGLVVGARNDVNSLLVAPGAPVVVAPFAASKSGVQTPLIGALPSANPADYLDSVENAGGTADVFELTSSQPAPGNDRLDIVE